MIIMNTCVSIYFLSASLLNPAAILADQKSPDDDLTRLQGTWTTMAGPGKKARVTLTIAGDHAEVDLATKQGWKLHLSGTLKLDASAAPRALDWLGFVDAVGHQYPNIAGIYRLEDDEFTICLGGFAGPRPLKFEPGDGPFADVVVFTRKREEHAARGEQTQTQTQTQTRPIERPAVAPVAVPARVAAIATPAAPARNLARISPRKLVKAQRRAAHSAAAATRAWRRRAAHGRIVHASA